MELVEGDELSQRIARGSDAARRSVADRETDCRGAGSGARAGDHPPRSQTREHQGAAGRHVKVLDFGLAKTIDAAGRSSASATIRRRSRCMSHAGIILGTAAYMSRNRPRANLSTGGAISGPSASCARDADRPASVHGRDGVARARVGVEERSRLGARCRPIRRRPSGVCCGAVSSAIRRTACTISAMRASRSRMP